MNQHASNGQTTGVYFVSGLDSNCINDATPGTVDAMGRWPQSNAFWNVTSEAEAGTRTFYGSGLGQQGLGCWDWATMAPCVGPSFLTAGNSSRWASRRTPSTAASCRLPPERPGWHLRRRARRRRLDVHHGLRRLVALRPSLSTSAQRSSVDLRSQRCDGTVRAATWLDVRALEVDLTGADAEFTTFQTAVRDAVSGATLMTKEMVGTDGVLDLSTINAAAPSEAVG